MEFEKEIKRGEIYYAELNPVIGSEQGGFRPVLIIQNDIGNKYSPTVIIAPITSKQEKNNLPTHVFLSNVNTALPKDSIILLEQIRTIDKSRLRDYIFKLSKKAMRKVNRAIQTNFWNV